MTFQPLWTVSVCVCHLKEAAGERSLQPFHRGLRLREEGESRHSNKHHGDVGKKRCRKNVIKYLNTDGSHSGEMDAALNIKTSDIRHHRRCHSEAAAIWSCYTDGLEHN